MWRCSFRTAPSGCADVRSTKKISRCSLVSAGARCRVRCNGALQRFFRRALFFFVLACTSCGAGVGGSRAFSARRWTRLRRKLIVSAATAFSQREIKCTTRLSVREHFYCLIFALRHAVYVQSFLFISSFASKIDSSILFYLWFQSPFFYSFFIFSIFVFPLLFLLFLKKNKCCYWKSRSKVEFKNCQLKRNKFFDKKWKYGSFFFRQFLKYCWSQHFWN